MVEFVRMGLIREEGQALVEYALIIALIAVVTVGALQLLGAPNPTVFSSIADLIHS